MGEAVRLARDLVNQPGGTLTPTAFATRAEELADLKGFDVEVLDRAAIEDEKLGGLLGVNRGSTEEPRFVKLTWDPPGKARGTVALVGKGITFDSGGLSLKPTDSMIGDEGRHGRRRRGARPRSRHSTPCSRRCGCAATCRSPTTCPGGDATRVGDVLRIRNGTTVEVLNTDAEGRLVLADALALASEDEPDAIVDLATLTGACMVALGTKIAGLMGNHEGFVDQVQAAADAEGEPVWPLPLPTEMRAELDSEVADIKNIVGQALGRGVGRRRVPAGVRRRRHPLGPPRHRRPGRLGRGRRPHPQGRHRLRRPHPAPLPVVVPQAGEGVGVGTAGSAPGASPWARPRRRSVSAEENRGWAVSSRRRGGGSRRSPTASRAAATASSAAVDPSEKPSTGTCGTCWNGDTSISQSGRSNSWPNKPDHDEQPERPPRGGDGPRGEPEHREREPDERPTGRDEGRAAAPVSRPICPASPAITP